MNDELYENLNQEDAVLVGILSELTQIRVALQTIANQSKEEESVPRFKCASCGQKAETEDVLLAHIVDEHKAPGEKAAKRLIENVE